MEPVCSIFYNVARQKNEQKKSMVGTGYLDQKCMEAALVMPGLIPIDLPIGERHVMESMEDEKSERRKRAMEEIMREWQVEWENVETGGWIRRLIKDVIKWKERNHGSVSYLLPQILTFYGTFAQYLDRFKIRVGEVCEECGQQNTPKHLLVSCNSWRREVENMSRKVGERIVVDNVIDIALKRKKEWSATVGMMATIMKEEKEKMRSKDG